jgi:outer membrane protein TolC
MPDARFDPTEGLYSASLLLDLPFERTEERNAYREAYLDLEQAVRDLQALEDTIKLNVRSALRQLLESRESAGIQVEAVRLARDRVTSTNLFLEAGRAQVRDVLDAQESLLSAQNALTEAFVGYRVAELEFQRDLGVLQVATTGTWTELWGDGKETNG